MKRIGIAAALLVALGLASGCSSKPATSTPAPPTNGGSPKSGETKSNVGKGGLENPPPP